jgi:hypothetical protein
VILELEERDLSAESRCLIVRTARVPLDARELIIE